MFKNAAEEFEIFSQNYDPFKNSCSLVIQIYAMQDGGNCLIKRFLGYACTTEMNHQRVTNWSIVTDFERLRF